MKKRMVKDLVDVENKLDEIDSLLSKARVVINELFWDLKISMEKRKRRKP